MSSNIASNLNNIYIVLVRTFHSGNIGSAARAMKTMGLKNLILVSPKDFPSTVTLEQAHQMARTAADVVDNALVVESLAEALEDCSLVIASTARPRGFDLPELTPEESAIRLCSVNINNKENDKENDKEEDKEYNKEENTKYKKVALVFGPERMGLNNEDLKLCRYRVTIPTSPDYSSLNLAAAVQTLCYEIFKQQQKLTENKQISSEKRLDLPTTNEMEQLYSHLEETLIETGFIIKNHPGEIMQKLRTLFTRAQVETSELNILRGILASVQRSKNGKP